jgi:penicillin-binding protein 2
VQVVGGLTTDNTDRPWKLRDHGWFASFAPIDEPQLVVVVFAEHGGGGSLAASPIAKEIYEEFFDIRERREAEAEAEARARGPRA